jgi:hypothetical protein
MDRCLVYLDEAHTRGTDLKLPLDARGALTLALHQTKDHTVQGMRSDSIWLSVPFSFPFPVDFRVLLSRSADALLGNPMRKQHGQDRRFVISTLMDSRARTTKVQQRPARPCFMLPVQVHYIKQFLRPLMLTNYLLSCHEIAVTRHHAIHHFCRTTGGPSKHSRRAKQTDH